MHAKADENLDYIIVLGAQVRADGPSKVLKHRLNTAIDYLEKNRRQSVLCQVDRGITSHLRKRRRWLIMWKRPELSKDRLILEDKSKTTEQNIKYSKKYMKTGASVGIITNDFHVFSGNADYKR